MSEIIISVTRRDIASLQVAINLLAKETAAAKGMHVYPNATSTAHNDSMKMKLIKERELEAENR